MGVAENKDWEAIALKSVPGIQVKNEVLFKSKSNLISKMMVLMTHLINTETEIPIDSVLNTGLNFVFTFNFIFEGGFCQPV